MSNKYNISAFTHKGTFRDNNQDHILINGQLLNKGIVYLPNESNCICFVADGVGGSKAGDFASHFVLNKIKALNNFNEIDNALIEINKQLISESESKIDLLGTATTLTGLIIKENFFRIVHAGDSELWLLRNDMFFKITNDQVLNQNENNSPITSYFGGENENLQFDTDIFVKEAIHNDIFLICSDGLFKSLSKKEVKSILKNENDLKEKVNIIMNECLFLGAEDNVSVILIQVLNDVL